MCVDSPTSKMKVDNKLSYKIVVGELAHKPSREYQQRHGETLRGKIPNSLSPHGQKKITVKIIIY
jgi:hypothetical protein